MSFTRSGRYWANRTFAHQQDPIAKRQCLDTENPGELTPKSNSIHPILWEFNGTDWFHINTTTWRWTLAPKSEDLFPSDDDAAQHRPASPLYTPQADVTPRGRKRSFINDEVETELDESDDYEPEDTEDEIEPPEIEPDEFGCYNDCDCMCQICCPELH